MPDVNDQIELRAEVTNSAGNAADPTEITIRHTDPSGNTAEEVFSGGAGNVVKDALGDFNLPLVLDEAGRWKWSTQTTGIIMYQERVFYVRERNVPDPP